MRLCFIRHFFQILGLVLIILLRTWSESRNVLGCFQFVNVNDSNQGAWFDMMCASYCPMRGLAFGQWCNAFSVLCLICLRPRQLMLPYSMCPPGGSIVTCEWYWLQQPAWCCLGLPVNPRMRSSFKDSRELIAAFYIKTVNLPVLMLKRPSTTQWGAVDQPLQLYSDAQRLNWRDPQFWVYILPITNKLLWN